MKSDVIIQHLVRLDRLSSRVDEWLDGNLASASLPTPQARAICRASSGALWRATFGTP